MTPPRTNNASEGFSVSNLGHDETMENDDEPFVIPHVRGGQVNFKRHAKTLEKVVTKPVDKDTKELRLLGIRFAKYYLDGFVGLYNSGTKPTVYNDGTSCLITPLNAKNIFGHILGRHLMLMPEVENLPLKYGSVHFKRYVMEPLGWTSEHGVYIESLQALNDQGTGRNKDEYKRWLIINFESEMTRLKMPFSSYMYMLRLDHPGLL